MKSREETQHRKIPVGIFGESCLWLVEPCEEESVIFDLKVNEATDQCCKC